MGHKLYLCYPSELVGSKLISKLKSKLGLHQIIDPYDHGIGTDEKIGAMNLELINECDIVIAVIKSESLDQGAELMYAKIMGKSIYLIGDISENPVIRFLKPKVLESIDQLDSELLMANPKIHYCFKCGEPFISEGADCQVCGFDLCPQGHCACDLGEEARKAIEAFTKTYCSYCDPLLLLKCQSGGC